MPATPPAPYGAAVKPQLIIATTALAFGSLLGAVATTLIADGGSAAPSPTTEPTASVQHVCSSRVPTDCTGP